MKLTDAAPIQPPTQTDAPGGVRCSALLGVRGRLERVRGSAYPLTVSREEAEALLECVQMLMAAVPEADKAVVAGWYDTISSTLWHPES